MMKASKLFLPLLLLFLTPMVRAQETVTIDLSANNGAATNRGSGFLSGYNASQPADSLLTPMKSKLLRLDAGLENIYSGDPVSSALYSRATSNGGAVMYILGDAWIQNFGGFNPSGARAVTSSTMSAWNAMVALAVNTAKASGQHLQWDIWNEPDITVFWTGSESDYQAMWQNAVNTIRGIDGSQVIVGPSTCCNGSGSAWGSWATDLMSFAKANNVLPNIIAIHATQTGSSYTAANMNSDVSAIKSYLAANDPSITQIDVTETVSQNDVYLPGVNVQFLAVAERQKLNGVAHSCWNNGSDCAQNGYPPDLDGLLATDGSTTHAVWYAYQAYANITGTIVNVTPSQTVDGVAGQDSNLQQAYSVFGRNGGSTANVTYNFTNVSSASYLNSGGTVHAVAYLLANDNGNGSSGPVQVVDTNVSVASNAVSVTVPNMGSNDVAIVQLTPSGNSGASRPSPPTISQIVVH
jgi:hypothetical protein